jgi:hypothetical protein
VRYLPPMSADPPHLRGAANKQETAAPRPYHHGDLRAALLSAAEEELAERGMEAFSLRSVAKRAGVSHAAPAHHFGDAQGLLTALAAEGFPVSRCTSCTRGGRREGCGFAIGGCGSWLHRLCDCPPDSVPTHVAVQPSRFHFARPWTGRPSRLSAPGRPGRGSGWANCGGRGCNMGFGARVGGPVGLQPLARRRNAGGRRARLNDRRHHPPRAAKGRGLKGRLDTAVSYGR